MNKHLYVLPGRWNFGLSWWHGSREAHPIKQVYAKLGPKPKLGF